MSGAEAAEQIRDGHEVELRPGWHRLGDLPRLVDAVTTVLEARAGLELHVAGRRGSPSRWFDHDLLVIALEREVRVELRGPAVAAPVPGHSPAPSGAPWQTALEPATALLVPRGWAVRVEADGPTVWFGASLRRLRGTDLAAYGALALAGRPEMRAQIPLRYTDEQAGPVARLRAELGAVDLAAFAADAAAWWAARLPSVREPRPSEVLAAGAPPPLAPGGWMLVERLAPDDSPPGGSVHPDDHLVAAAGSTWAGTEDELVFLAGSAG
jgi:hypothetical protein